MKMWKKNLNQKFLKRKNKNKFLENNRKKRKERKKKLKEVT